MLGQAQTHRARIARVILRTAQRTPGVSRTSMSSQVRPYGAEWTSVLDELMTREFIIESSHIAARRKNRRAVIVYNLGPAAENVDFEELEPEEVHKLVYATAAA